MMKYFFSILFVLVGIVIQAQNPERCGMTMEAHEQMMQENESYRIHYENWRKKVEKIISSQGKNPSCANGPIIVLVGQYAIRVDQMLCELVKCCA